MTVSLSPILNGFQSFTSAGLPNSGGFLYTYAAGTSTLQTTYTSSNGSTPNANPIVFDSAGRAPQEIWLTDGLAYKLVVADSTTAPIAGCTYDNVGFGVGFTAANGSFLVGYTQGSTGAVASTVQTKLRENISIKDFGAVGDGVTDDYAAWANLVSNYPTAQVTCDVPMGTFTCTSTAVIVPSNIKINMKKGAVIAGSAQLHFKNVLAANANDSKVKPLETSLGFPADQASFNYLELTGNSGAGGNVVAHNVDLVDTQQNVQSNAGGAYARYSEVRHGGAGSSGGFVATGGFSYLTSNGNPAAAHNDSVGVAGYAASLGFNCGGTVGTPKGNLYGSNFYARLDSGATYFSNITGSEVNTEVRTGASVAYKSGIQISPTSNDLVSGYLYDCALAMSKQAGSIGFDTGILYGPMNGDFPVKTTGTLIKTVGAATYGTGIDFSSATFNTAILKSSAVTLLDGGLVFGNASTTTRFVDFKSSGNPPNYNARLLCQGGSVTDASGDVSLLAQIVRLPTIVPLTDSISNLGSASLRYNTVYAITGAINTSDARSKQDISKLSDAEIRVAQTLKGLIRKFRFVDAVTAKGSNARIHVGVIAQDVAAAFEAEKLNGFDYSVLCFDEWPEVLEKRDENNTIILSYQPAGNRYGVRYDELFAFIIAAI